MTPKQFKTARTRLGMSHPQMAAFLKIRSDVTTRRWESAKVPIPHSVALLLRWLVCDEKPEVPE